MKISEIGLSLYQPIRKTCFSGYIYFPDGIQRDYYINVDFAEQFEGDGELEISVLSDADDCFASASFHGRTKKLCVSDLWSGNGFTFRLSGAGYSNYMCLYYKVLKGSFTKGQITARITSERKAWFINQDETFIECLDEKYF